MNNQDILEKILNRAQEIQAEKRRKQKTWAVAVASFLLVIGISAGVPTLLATATAAEQTDEIYVGSLLVQNAGMGYVLVGVFALIVGAIATLICCKWRDKKK
ncbi:MAG: hypothetical protein R3Y62_08265 [Eubacteriales bacterium]